MGKRHYQVCQQRTNMGNKHERHSNHFMLYANEASYICTNSTPETNNQLFSHPVVSDSLRPHGLQHARPPCPSPSPEVCPSSCPLHRWCHPTISSSVVPFSFHLKSFTASGSFQMSQLFTSGGQSIGVSDSASVLPMNTQDWSPLRWTGWISLQ